MKVALFGFGYWGQKIYQTLVSEFNQVVVVETADYLDRKADQYQSVKFIQQQKAIADPSVKLYFIATPEQTHYQLVQKCLTKNKHVFVEKPLCLKANRAEELVELAETQASTLYVDYIFLLDQAFETLHNIILKEKLGRIMHIDSYRLGSGIDWKSVPVTDDLMIHDLYLCRALGGLKKKLRCSLSQRETDNLVSQAIIDWKTDNFSWTGYYDWDSYQSERKLVVHGEKGKVVWLKTEDGDKIQHYEYPQSQPKLISERKITKTPQPLSRSVGRFLELIKSEQKSQRLNRYRQYISDISFLETARKDL